MKKATKILGIGVCFVFLLAGASYGTTLDLADLTDSDGADYYFEYGGSPWAELNVKLAGPTGDYTYTYTLTVLDGDGTYGATVHILQLPAVVGHYEVLPQGAGGVPYTTEFPVGDDQHWFIWDELPAGSSSSPIILGSDYGPEIALATIQNSGVNSSSSVAAAIVGAGGGGGGDPLPEPATLLLLGSGLFGAGAFRYLRSRKTAN